ncbi:putative nucleoside-diphosphate sugar epimerase [Methylophaga frappieri]|uniref:Putative nucleoside-diphosphate sugar epimerase n=1 Tax=Methylophaga frappieri (strain ATCC BAA-2434 / DSM 25690 / JAM7) TaxID=754477 RepID=I1YFY7_METFJ|nr:SDR family oxidoreductase [Methylophaga frappieri]AFJ01830.1 putative nucleoside-diphosphate sugar epimerase [Methylophaga frappieri]
MYKTLVVGANGQIGRLLVTQLLDQSRAVRVMVREASQADFFRHLGAEVVIADLEQPLPDKAFEQCNKVVFTAGSGGHTGAEKTILIDLWGACKVIDMAVKHHVAHFVMVSAQDAGDPDNGNPAIRHYNVCKHFADEYLMHSPLAYTILRPGRLTDEIASQRIQTYPPIESGQRMISRSDVANCIAYCLNSAQTKEKIFLLFHGNQTIRDALI